ncbi:MAG: RNA-directed DNA polymerase [Cyanobacteria bacterium SZAS-4]|nr:RNA-directed DNA polymerase [Cyanobacteria bacterium SZAS-4]
MTSNLSLTLTDLCDELELPSQFVLDLANSAEDEKRYHSYKRLKKSGGARYINASVGSLKRLQRSIHERILSRHKMPEHLHGGIKGRSIVTNAAAHVGKKLVINIDLTDFFSTIKVAVVKQIYMRDLHFDDETATVLAQVSTFKGALPTGAPTSSALANLAGLVVDDAVISTLTKKIERTEFGYSRYVDDITISGDDRIVEILPDIFEAVKSAGFTCNDKKTRILRRSTRQWVTGVVVNRKLNPPKNIVRKIRQYLYYMHRWGVEEHCETHGINPYRFMRQITGYIAYVRLTQPELADEFLRSLKPHLARFHQVDEESAPSTLNILKVMIDKEEIAHFLYDREDRAVNHPSYEPVAVSVAPESLDVDDDGTLTMRGFELAPKQRWGIYHLESISALSDKPLTDVT